MTRRVWALVYRHLALFAGSWPRLLDLAYWPVMQMLIWGFTAQFFAARLGSAPAVTGGLLLAGVLLWEVALRGQMGFAVSFLEEVWSRNLGQIFIAPLRPREFVVALVVMSFLRMAAGVIPAALLAYALYAFNLLAIGPALVPFVAALMMTGWSVALAVTSLVLRHGAGAEGLVWGLLFALTPFACVFYPVSTLPVPLQAVALALPPAHVFEGMRALLTTGTLRWDALAWAYGLDIVWLSLAATVFTGQFRRARVSGALLAMGE